MSAVRSIASSRSFVRLAAVVATGLALALALALAAAPAPALADGVDAKIDAKRLTKHEAVAIAASVSDQTLFANASTVVLQWFPWYEGGGACSASGSARWDRGTNLLSLNGSAHTSAPFRACRARLRVDFWATDSSQDYKMGTATADIDTACANLDPSCPSTQPLNVVLGNALPGTFFGIPKTQLIDHITLTPELR